MKKTNLLIFDGSEKKDLLTAETQRRREGLRRICGGFLAFILASLLFFPAGLYAADMGSYCSAPPYVTRSIAPNVMVLIDNSTEMYNPAYCTVGTPLADGTMTCRDPYEETLTKNNYIGYFIPEGCYKYQGTSFKEELIGGRSYNATDNGRLCPSTAPYRGNLLNWATMSQFDVLESVIIGGESNPEQVSPGHSAGSYTLKSPSSKIWTKYWPTAAAPECIFYVNSGSITITDTTAGSCSLLNTPNVPFAFQMRQYLNSMWAWLSDKVYGIANLFSNSWQKMSELASSARQKGTVVAYAAWDQFQIIADAWAAACGSLAISSSSPLTATIGLNYNIVMTESGGSGNDTWTRSDPAGFTAISFTFSGSNNNTATWTAMPPSSCATYTMSATVEPSGCGGATKTKSFAITVVSPTLKLNTLTLSNGQTGSAYSFSMNASGGVPTNIPTTPATYIWSISSGSCNGTTCTGGNLPSGLSLNQSTGVISGTPTSSGTATNITITVKDQDHATSNCTQQSVSTIYSLTVNPASLSITNSPPNGTVGTAYGPFTMNGSGGTSPYTWSYSGVLPAGLTFSGGVLSGTPTTATSYTPTITLTDSSGTVKSITPTITISTAALSITNTPTATGQVGVAYGPFTMTGSGGTGGYTWSAVGLPNGLSISAAGSISGTPTASGTFTPTITLKDSAGTTVLGSYSISISPATLSITNTPPNGQDRVAYSFFMAGSGGVAPYTWSATGLPAEYSINASTGDISGYMDRFPSAYPLTFTPTIKLTDAAGTVKTINPTIRILPPPLLITNAPPNGTNGTGYSFTMTATGGNSIAGRTWSFSGLPTGLSWNAAGDISGTPTVDGTYSVTITVTDTYTPPNTTSQVFTIVIGTSPLTVTCPYWNGVFSTWEFKTGSVGASYSSTLNRSGGIAPYTFSEVSHSIPAGLNLDTSTGEVYGTPTTAGTAYVVNIKVVDSGAGSARQTYTASCRMRISGTTLSITNSPTATGTVGVAYGPFTMTGTGGSGSGYSWSLSAGSLPPGMNLSAGGVLSGTPSTSGAYPVTIKLVDDIGSIATLNVNFTINPAAGLLAISSTTPLPAAPVDTLYSTGLIGVGGTSPYLWSNAGTYGGGTCSGGTCTSGNCMYTGGGLPTSLSLNRCTGIISGTPLSAPSEVGTYTIAVTLKDSTGATSSDSPKTFTINVTPPALQITTTSLPDVVKSTSYLNYDGTTPVQFAAKDGYPGYTWSATGLPAWLSLSAAGILSGTAPNATGTTPQFTVRVTDSHGTWVEKPFSVTVVRALVLRSSGSLNVAVERLEEAATDMNGNNIWDSGEAWTDSNGNGIWDGKKGLFQQFYDVNTPRARWGVSMYDKLGAVVVGSPTTACLPASPAQPFYSNIMNSQPSAAATDLATGLYGTLNYYGFTTAGLPVYGGTGYSGCGHSDPIDDVPCRKNFILILTAGYSVVGTTYPPTVNPACTQSDPLVRNACVGYNTDLRIEPSKPGKQQVYTYIVNMMGQNDTILKAAADAGHGKYYKAENAADLPTQLQNALNDILGQAASGTAVSVLTTSSRGVGSMTQAYFLPKTLEGDRDVWWTGYTSQIWIDSKDNLREDSTNDAMLQYDKDYVMKTYFDATANETKAALFSTLLDGTGGDLADCKVSQTKLFGDIVPIWEGGKKLALKKPSARNLFTSDRVIFKGYSTTTFTKSSCGTDNTGGHTFPINANCFTKANIVDGGNPTLKAALDWDATYSAENIVRYVRGECLETSNAGLPVTDDAMCTATTNGIFRDRRMTIRDTDVGKSVLSEINGNVWKLGDIISATPKVVSGASNNTYNIDYGDTTYRSYFTGDSFKHRASMVFAGANDGVFHAFRIGHLKDKSDNNGGFVSGVKALFRNFYVSADPSVGSGHSQTDKNDRVGDEVWGFIPYNSFPYLKYLANTGYCHIYYNDLTPTVIDASLGCSDVSCDEPTETKVQDATDPTKRSWKTIVVGGMRFGGACGQGTPTPPIPGVGYSSYFAIDVTDPEKPVPLWEFSDSDLGFTTSMPAILRTGDKNQNGYWYLAFGSGSTTMPKNGVSVTRSKPGYIYILDLKTGSLVKKIQTANNDMIGDIFPVDEDKDYASEKVYFGTSYYLSGVLRGSVYRMDIPNTNLAGIWTPAATPKRLFDDLFPFTASPDISKDNDGNLWVYAGSGMYFSDLDETDTSNQIFVGFKDTSAKIPAVTTYPLSATNLTDTSTYVTKGTVIPGTGTTTMCNFNGTSFAKETVVTGIAQTSGAPPVIDKGWKFPLSGGERVISMPLVVGGLVDFLTYKPSSDACSYGGDSYLYSLGYTSGVAPATVAIRSSAITGGAISGEVIVSPGIRLGPGAPPTGEAIIIPPVKEGETTLNKKIQVATGVIIEAVNSPVYLVTSKIVHWLKK